MKMMRKKELSTMIRTCGNCIWLNKHAHGENKHEDQPDNYCKIYQKPVDTEKHWCKGHIEEI